MVFLASFVPPPRFVVLPPRPWTGGMVRGGSPVPANGFVVAVPCQRTHTSLLSDRSCRPTFVGQFRQAMTRRESDPSCRAFCSISFVAHSPRRYTNCMPPVVPEACFGPLRTCVFTTSFAFIMATVSRSFITFLAGVDTPERNEAFIKRAAAAFSLCEAGRTLPIELRAYCCLLFWQASAEADLLSFEVAHVPAEYTITEQGQPSPGAVQLPCTISCGVALLADRLACLHVTRGKQGHGQFSKASRQQHC